MSLRPEADATCRVKGGSQTKGLGDGLTAGNVVTVRREALALCVPPSVCPLHEQAQQHTSHANSAVRGARIEREATPLVSGIPVQPQALLRLRGAFTFPTRARVSQAV
jgi:hypothetical protein